MTILKRGQQSTFLEDDASCLAETLYPLPCPEADLTHGRGHPITKEQPGLTIPPHRKSTLSN